LAVSFSVLLMAGVNLTLTRIVNSLVNRRRFFHWSWFTRSSLYNESLCVVSGLGMAVLWSVNPWLVFLGVLPVWTTLFMLTVHSRGEQTLDARDAELRSLQELGLELGRELDEERLQAAVLRLAGDALDAGAALIGTRDEADGPLRILAHRGLGAGPPVVLPLTTLDDELFEQGQVGRVDGGPEVSRRYPALAWLKSSGVLLAPLEMHGQRNGLLALFRGEDRRPFDLEDAGRLASLVRFINVALSNAQLVGELQQMQVQLAQSDKMSALGMLVSGVAHELNNPLTSIMGYAELLSVQEGDPRRRRMMERIGNESRRAGKIVQNLLTFSRRYKPEKKLISINKVLADVLDFRAYELRVRNIEVVERLTPDLPTVHADAHRFQQVFLNLISNAEQAVEQGERPGVITIASELCNDTVRIVVSDNGCGIHPGDLQQVFVPFFTTKEVGSGTGLGLSICYGIVEEHGGRIDVEPVTQGGTSFVVELPAAGPPESELAPDADPPSVTAPDKPILPGRLLVLDDEEPITSLVTEFFEERGWLVSPATEGEHALELIADGDFDALVVDMRMPGMDGQTFFGKLQALRPDLAPKVIFSTGDTGNQETVRFIEETGSPILQKPFNLEELNRMIGRSVERIDA